MHIETDADLLSDPLWSALEKAIRLWEEEPRFGYVTHPERYGIDVQSINPLAGKAGISTRPVFEIHQRAAGTKIVERWLSVYHPDRDDPVVMRDLWDAESEQLRGRLVAYFRAWQDRRAEQIKDRRRGRGNRRGKQRPDAGGKLKRRKQRSDAGGKLKTDASREILGSFVRDECGGSWDGTQLELREALKKKTGLVLSQSTISRYLAQLGHAPKSGRPHRATRPGGRQGSEETEGIAREPDDMSDLDAYTMPGDDGNS